MANRTPTAAAPKSKPKLEEVTIEDETETEPPKKQKPPPKDNSYMDGMYDPKVAEFLAGGQSMFGDNNNNSSPGLHKDRGV